MTKTFYYQIARHIIQLCIPEDGDIDRLLPSFIPFKHTEETQGHILTRLTVSFSKPTQASEDVPMETSSNNLGDTRLFRTTEGYAVEFCTKVGKMTHRMCADATFGTASVRLNPEDPRKGHVLCSLLRIAFSQAILPYGGISLHAAAVVCEGKAYLFMGKSGTGKSTHAALWIRCFPDCILLNDDNPAVSIANGKAMAYGTPWSGKTSCYKNMAFPIGGIVRLRQAPNNCFTDKEGVEAFAMVLPGCAVIQRDNKLHNALCSSLLAAVQTVPIGLLECRPDEAAAHLCAKEMNRRRTQELNRKP